LTSHSAFEGWREGPALGTRASKASACRPASAQGWPPTTWTRAGRAERGSLASQRFEAALEIGGGEGRGLLAGRDDSDQQRRLGAMRALADSWLPNVGSERERDGWRRGCLWVRRGTWMAQCEDPGEG
jgi:hypothetical protein